MFALCNALLCGLVGAIAAYTAYTWSNQFLYRDPIRRGRHPLWDPLGFAAIGGLFGLGVGAAFAAWLSSARPLPAIGLGVVATLVGIAATGGIVTWQRDRELPRPPALTGPAAELLFELRLPVDKSVADAPRQVLLAVGGPRPIDAKCAAPMAGAEGRLVAPGRVPLRYAVERPLLSVLDDGNCWVNFELPIPAQPGPAATAWSDWLTACNADPQRTAEQSLQLRCRVRFAGDR